MAQNPPTASGESAGTTLEQRWVLALASVASFMVVLDMLVVATALTTIRHALHTSLAGLEWTVNAYTLSFAVLLMTAAAVGDRLGRRRVFAAGLVVFGAASAGCALATDPGTLIATRAVQGVGAAMIMPTALALLNGAFPPARRGWAIGIYGSVTALAVSAGPILGGAVTQGLGWQWIFWLNEPIAAVAIPMVFARMKEATRPGGTVDVVGLVLVTAAALGLVWALVRGNAVGWGSAETVGTLVGGAVAAIAFAAWETRARHPMVPARLFRSPAFSAGNAGIFLLNASLSGAIFLMPQFQQVVRGQDALSAGLSLLPFGIAPALVAPRAGALADRIGARALVVAGLLLQTVAMTWIAAITGPHTAYPVIIAPMSIAGIGFGLAIPALTRSVTSTVPPPDIGRASGAFSTMRQLGGAFGVAILGAAFAAAGSYASPPAFTNGFVAAYGVAAGLAFAGAVTGMILPKRGAHPAPVAPARSGQVASIAAAPRQRATGEEHRAAAASSE